MSPSASPIELTARQRTILEKWARNKAKMPHRVVERSTIVLMSAEGLTNQEQARRLRVDRQRVRRWRDRWAANQARLLDAEKEPAEEKDLAKLMADLLEDEPRSGAPPRFTAEELAQIIAVACEPPADSGRPVTHWTPREVADEAVKRGIVKSISPRHVDRVPKGGISARIKVATG
jgi:putative transposase